MLATNNPSYQSLAEMGGRELRFIREVFNGNWVVLFEPNVNNNISSASLDFNFRI